MKHYFIFILLLVGVGCQKESSIAVLNTEFFHGRWQLDVSQRGTIRGSGPQIVPFYNYYEDGTGRIEPDLNGSKLLFRWAFEQDKKQLLLNGKIYEIVEFSNDYFYWKENGDGELLKFVRVK
jgi:hypothetical protein